ncbi:unnamed protein product [Arabis nemorensis]|uniref:Transport inhibitor response 1 domain-containing protein n=1 Tax=Arabis nemorensis TaxID=586526 RepID=A0A565CF23_9BRAS|nr:unnamed protein product [Arabis nemorensis]
MNAMIRLVLEKLEDPVDLSTASLVSTAWYDADSNTRERITVPLSYAASPGKLSQRFPNVKYLRVKVRPSEEMFELVSAFWGGSASPWINEIAISGLEALELNWCRGFTTDGLMSITKRCRNVESLVIGNCLLEERNGEWLHEIALHNSSLKVLHCHESDISMISLQDLETIVERCLSLISLKISDFDLAQLEATLRAATRLEEFYGGCIIVDPDNEEDNDKYMALDESIPPNLCRVGDLIDLHVDEISILFGFANRIQKLDLFRTDLLVDAHCILLEKLPNLEVLKTSNNIGDRGLIALSQFCKKLKELEISLVGDEEENERWDCTVPDRGMRSVAENCKGLESIVVCMIKVSDSSLLAIAELKELRRFELVLIPTNVMRIESLDNGVGSLLSSCGKIRKITLHLLPGCLSDLGMGYIGEFGRNLRRVKLVSVGDSDLLAKGCKQLQKLEMVNCPFNEKGLATAVTNLSSLKYLWACGYNKVERRDLSIMSHPRWKIELSSSAVEENCHLVAYPCLGYELSDYPEIIVRYN